MARGEPVMMTSSWGLTETSPLATAAHFPIDRAGVIGVPVPGVELKLAPVEGKLEMRVKGPNVTPGYLGQPDLTAKAFDEDGWYRTGDAAKLEDPDDPNRGVVFDGRVVEDFKLLTGTFVSVGNLRVRALAAASPLLMDAVVCGHDRDYVGLLAWLNLGAAREIAGRAGGRARRARAVAEGARVRPRAPAGLQRRAPGVLDPGGARGPARGAAVAGRQRDHRQGLRQPARGARAAQRVRRRAVRGASRRGGDHLPVGMPKVGGEVVEESDCLDGVLGFEVVSIGDGEAVARFPVADRVRQRFGLVHGGAYAALAEMIATEATVAVVHPDGFAAMGSSNDTSFLKPARGDWITARARARHRGRTTWVWEVDHTDGEDRLVAVSRVTIAVRPRG